MIYMELCMWLKFDHADKKWLQIPESLLENEEHNILCDIDIKTDHHVPTVY